MKIAPHYSLSDQGQGHGVTLNFFPLPQYTLLSIISTLALIKCVFIGY